ncbi:MAG TPA: tRNA pseudouridine(13) synthase TruD [Nitrososphaerales archaeon]|nr:tRNA pseudouridine(13) synthase TruD [Nitrososphaerales archaeon]
MIPALDSERAVGIGVYSTLGPPCHARAKASDEDFRVEEYIAFQEVSPEEKPGYYPLYRVQKHSIDTMHMARELSGILRSRVSYGGLKDKRAAAIQYVTPTSTRSERPPEVVMDKFSARLVGFVPRPISRGSIVGNRFEVTLRDCCREIGQRADEALKLASERMMPSFYGLQRFGTSGPGTHRVGKAMVKKEFDEAVRLILSEVRPGDNSQTLAAKEAFRAERYEEGLSLLSMAQDVESMVARSLIRDPGDSVKALRHIPLNLRRLYVEAYQSAIFNETMSEAIAKGEDISTSRPGDNWAEVSEDGMLTSEVHGAKEASAVDGVPMVQLVGYGTRDYGSRFDACINSVLDRQEIGAKDFYVKEMQEVSAEGGFRRPHMAIKDSSCDVKDGTAILRFTLARGQYATVLLREIIKPGDPESAGLA